MYFVLPKAKVQLIVYCLHCKICFVGQKLQEFLDVIETNIKLSKMLKFISVIHLAKLTVFLFLFIA